MNRLKILCATALLPALLLLAAPVSALVSNSPESPPPIADPEPAATAQPEQGAPAPAQGQAGEQAPEQKRPAPHRAIIKK